MENTGGANDLKPCQICGRTFRPDTLERHQNICVKASQKRKVFDSKKQRAGAIEKVEAPPRPKESTVKVVKKPISKKANWREKHDDLIDTIRKSRDGNNTKSDSNVKEKKKIPSDYVQCPGCQRHFNQRAADRHIPWCLQKQQENNMSAVSSDAKEKLIARVKYRVPPPGKAKRYVVKPKTANEPTVRSNENQQVVKRSKETYSSPPTLVDKRNNNVKTSSSNNNNHNYYASKPKSRDSGHESRGSLDSKGMASPDSSHPIIKFKERFPNHISKRGMDLEDSFTAEQLQELLRCHRLGDQRCPKTVPGVRLSTKANNWISSWSNGVIEGAALPEVSSSELPDSWMGKLGWTKDLDASISSSGSSNSSSSGSLPPMSRENRTEAQMSFYCHQCHHKFPLVGAKYCCECGARRRGVRTI